MPFDSREKGTKRAKTTKRAERTEGQEGAKAKERKGRWSETIEAQLLQEIRKFSAICNKCSIFTVKLEHFD